MALLKASQVRAVTQTAQVVFDRITTGDTVQPLHNQFCTTITSTQRTENLAWGDVLGTMREWLGSRQHKNVRLFTWAIENKHWEHSVSVNADDVEDENLGLFPTRVQSMARAAMYHPDILAANLLINGFSDLCYDGQYFFDSDHPYYSDGAAATSYSNVSDIVFSATNYETAVAAMMKVQSEQGFYINAQMFQPLVIVGPSNRSTVKDVFDAERNSAGASNTLYKDAKYIILPQLQGDYAKYWFVINVAHGIMPLIITMRKPPQLVSMDEPNDERLYEYNELRYGVDYRGNAGYGIPQIAWGSDGSAT